MTVFIPPSKKRGYIGVTVSGSLSVCLSVCLSVGRPKAIFCLAYFLQTTGWNSIKIVHEASRPRGDVHILKGYFTELWPFYLLSYVVGQGAVKGVFIIFSDSSSII